ncbi:hypothetical protein TpMuguga_04g02565 [Theileria parva strain Muguga]|uniref:uncharacterized protein n=1 Tax=Theileria parva strain Muguga TaxID=333668 RepID=UPI001C62050D|nr:uncharacterized protein TpMuguga_04g02565 [Theileria parva strain Muguga]KAF5153210.1 hypothetical protein TpMuguga_04g02565 [Theileria parva strain Muguga]
MVSYLPGRENFCNGQSHTPCHRIVQNDEEGSEIEFEGWIQLGNPVRERNRGCIGSCQRSCSMNSPNLHFSHNDNNCWSNNDAINVLWEHTPKSGCNHSCSHNLNPCNPVRRVVRCSECYGKFNGFDKQLRNENEIYYVNNRQNAPSVLVQKPQTVVVRNKSRPPIVVQQPPPNVIVKNDPPQPIYVQNPPPNITVKNSEPTPYRNYPFQNARIERGIHEEPYIRQSTCGMNRGNQNATFSHKRNHCIYHCKHPCCANYNM